MTEAVKGCEAHAPNPRTGDCNACKQLLQRNLPADMPGMDAARLMVWLQDHPVATFERDGRSLVLFHTEDLVVGLAKERGIEDVPAFIIKNLDREARLDALDAELTPEGYKKARAALFTHFYGGRGAHRRRGNA